MKSDAGNHGLPTIYASWAFRHANPVTLWVNGKAHEITRDDALRISVQLASCIRWLDRMRDSPLME